ncbi:M20 family metallopeptidase [Paenibacillus sp. SC116]|uniref:M20 family metallopeptidase n=1 Tax=Paenibacillus sp. SC116 TaxID=2968986 RepID=UPI00215A0EE7|nr:M20 family metallopeptidase [Paenibacillus sp. SC116]MCR8844317.1 M20 family metallopeptidase [Paenibacillus sp. SC116]
MGLDLHAIISDLVEKKRDKAIELSDSIWACPEIYFEEHQSAEYVCKALESEGFQVEREAAGLQTGFIGSYGEGKPIIAILGEYDALAGLSQKQGATKQEPVVAGGHGHGCGHNLLGAGAFAAAVAIKDYMQQTGMQGTVRYYGCPAEESGSGKAFIARAGLFNDVDLAFSWHPYTAPRIMNDSSLANYSVTFKFAGKSAHAAAAPHLGRSALDAVELMNVGVNYLREHMIPEARVHYAITDTGGISPNVVQPHAEVVYLIRAPQKQQVEELYERVLNVAKGAALMTGTTMEVEFEGAASNLIPNTTLASVMYKHMAALGAPVYDAADYQFAKDIRASLSPEDLQAAIAGWGREVVRALKDKDIVDFIPPLGDEGALSASTDVGDVSWVVPTMQCMTTCWALGTPFHTWQVVSQGTMPIAHKGMLQAGKVIACTAIDAMLNLDIIEQARSEWRERLDGDVYTSLIPEHVMPPVK